MRKIISMLLAVVFLISSLSGCARTSQTNAEETIHIVTTIFPVYDWVRQLLGEQAENVEMTMLLDNGVNPMFGWKMLLPMRKTKI